LAGSPVSRPRIQWNKTFRRQFPDISRCPQKKLRTPASFCPVEVDDDRSDQGNDDNTVCAEDDRQDPSEVRNSSQVAESDRGHNGKAVPQGVCKLASFFYD
jgi:hypothetical protein